MLWQAPRCTNTVAMADEHAIDSSTADFFLRSGLTSQTTSECFDLIRQLYPDKPVSVAACQGYCSWTLFVGDDTVVQFRPDTYRLSLRLTTTAREVYGTFAPETRYVATLPASGLLAYSMEKIAGISFKDFRASRSPASISAHNRANLCQDFARFNARSWKETRSRDLPLGVVGKSIEFRLRSLVSDLPHRFRFAAKRVLENLHQIEDLPWVLTHGDIVAGNIMVDTSNGKLTGLVDWAEAERLPFGVCLYGLEEILGEIGPTGFQYRHDASALRTVFWCELKTLLPELQKIKVLEAVKLARDLGVLLWQGIAFDDGAIDRVVQEGRDIEEIYRLEAFFGIQEGPPLSRYLKL